MNLRWLAQAFPEWQGQSTRASMTVSLVMVKRTVPISAQTPAADRAQDGWVPVHREEP